MGVSLIRAALLAAVFAGACDPSSTTPDDTDTTPSDEILPDPPSTAWADDVPAAMAAPVTVVDGGAILGFDPDKKDPITAYGDCVARLHGCLEETRGDFATCVGRAPVCQTDTPWEEGVCCPRACGRAYRAAVAAGAAPADAYLLTFGRDLSCFPGVTP